MSVDDAPSRKHHTSPGVLGLLTVPALLLLYGLSPIPVYFVDNHVNHRNFRQINKFYAPFGWAHDHTALRGVVERYGAFVSHL